MRLLKSLLRVCVLVSLASCRTGGTPPPIEPPAPPPVVDPLPICPPGSSCGCWHRPPGEEWQKLPDCTGPIEPPAPPPPQPPPVEGCALWGEPGPILRAYVSPKLADGTRLGDKVNSVITNLTGCAVGSRCIIVVRPQLWQAYVSAGLRKLGYCAGQHATDTDEISVQHPDTKAEEGFHVYAGSGWHDPLQTGTAVWYYPIGGPVVEPYVGSARPAYAPSGTAPVPPPPPVPVPPAPPTPSPGACGNPLPPKVWTAATLPDGWGQGEIGRPRWMISCGRHGKIIDCVAKVEPRACDYCASIGMGTMPDGVQPRCGCPVRQEGHPERVPCEAYLTGGTKLQTCAEARAADPKVTCQPVAGATCAFAHGNPFQFEQNDGQCRLCSNDGSVCSAEWF